MQNKIGFRHFLALSFIVALAWFGFLDRYAEHYINGSLATSTVSFGIARLFNATVSVLSSITLNVPVVGSVQIGELLDPLNDLVEDFSTVMKYAISSLLIQKFLVEISQTLHFKIFLTLTAVAYFFSGRYWPNRRQLAYRAFVLACACKFSIVLVALASSWVDAAFVEDKIEQANNSLEAFPIRAQELDQLLDLNVEIREQVERDIVVHENNKVSLLNEKLLLLEKISPLKKQLASVEQQLAAENEKEGLINSLVNKNEQQLALKTQARELNKSLAQLNSQIANLDRLVQNIDVDILRLERRLNSDVGTFESLMGGFDHVTEAAKSKITRYVDTLNNSIETFLNLMALFVLKTIVLPLLFLLVLYLSFKKLW